MRKDIKIYPGKGVTFPKGFLAGGVHAGFKKKKPDLALIYSSKECICVGSFTKNLFIAPPIALSKKKINNKIQAVIINSGNANACTGKQGEKNAREMCKITAKYLNINPKKVLAFSTGIIGKQLDIEKVKKGVGKLIPLLGKNSSEAAKAILTTDKRTKEIGIEFTIEGKKIRIGAMAKGSGMIAPNMGTMLAFLTSDINIERNYLKRIFKESVKQTFNRITVDGDMSTNDSVIFLANGEAGNSVLNENSSEKDKIKFKNSLLIVMQYLAKEIVKDGEGVTKLIKITVHNCKTEKEAEKIALRVGNSLLVKTAVYGGDPNWGRILAAAGSAGVKFDINKFVLKIGKITVYKNNKKCNFDTLKLKSIFNKKEVEINIYINTGSKSVTIYTGDLTEEYIKINSFYHT